VFTFQKNNPTSICTDYIYPKIHKISKGKPRKMDLPLLKKDVSVILKS